MFVKILHIEDSGSKHREIMNVLDDIGERDVDWETDLYSGYQKILESLATCPYDLIITDMYYPISSGGYDTRAGEILLDYLKRDQIHIPVIVISSAECVEPNAMACLLYASDSDWEIELKAYVEYLRERKLKQ